MSLQILLILSLLGSLARSSFGRAAADGLSIPVQQCFSDRKPFDLSSTLVRFRPRRTRPCATAPLNSFPHPSSGRQIDIGGDDDSSQEVALKFGFPFFGNVYSSAYVGANGYLTFGGPDRESQGKKKRHNRATRVAALMKDLALDASSSISYVSRSRKFVVTYRDVHLEGEPSKRASFQIALFDSGAVEVAYLQVGIDGHICAGLSNGVLGDATVKNLNRKSCGNGGSAATGTLKATHFWDCSGAACDADTLEPWDESRYRYSAFYAPLDPKDFPGGPVYGEKMWMTGAASDVLSGLMGADDGCCGDDTEGIGGCGKCLLVSNPTAVNSDWKAVVMKKNRCPPWATGCGSSQPHFDLAVPGYDNLEWSLANICGQSDTIISQEASTSCGAWWEAGDSTIQGCSCDSMPDSTPQQALMKRGCELFSAWGWTSGNPELMYEVVDCPQQHVEVVGAAFGPSGPIYP
mmetsp:Transcript_1536/g.4439  ORF Transcript_1536/g.4439 Transcript_1536/m.4439 type:complete len:463 (+) Transcript_1536:107-1495(+)